MKVVATITAGEEYLCQVKHEEIAMILGTDIDDEDIEYISVGTEINILRINKVAEWLKNLDTNQIARCRKEVSSMLQDFEALEKQVNALTLFEKLKEDYKEKM